MELRHPDKRTSPSGTIGSMNLQATSVSIVSLLTALVRTGSRAGLDPYDPVLEVVAGWLTRHGVPHRYVGDSSGARIGICGRIDSGRPGPSYLLNATVDTAPFGNEEQWKHPPLSATQSEGWLYGRGSGDSKAGVAIFCHLLAALKSQSKGWAGSLVYLFDAGEHTGEFTGVRRFIETQPEAKNLSGTLIGYPGNTRIAIGGRGFARCRLRVHGRAAHTGSSSSPGVNAIGRAAHLIDSIHSAPLPDEQRGSFPLPPRISVTAIEGGSGFSVVPDLCVLNVDIRLTTRFDRDAARAHVAHLVAAFDRDATELAPTDVVWNEGWPAYQLDSALPLVRALREAATAVLGRDIATEVVGPSSVGNYLSGRGVPATNGFGVTCENIHAANERIEISSISPVFEVYSRAVWSLLKG